MRLDTHQRFFRPPDVGRVRRNQRRIQVQRILGIARSVVLVVAVVAAALLDRIATRSPTRASP